MTTQVPIQPTIKFNQFQIVKLDFHSDDIGDPQITEGLDVNFNFNASKITEEKIKEDKSLENIFTIIFNIDFKKPNNKFVLSINALAIFESLKAVDEEFLKSPFVLLNAPAIAFPYLRTFISNFILNAGYHPVVLPAFNFAQVIKTQ